MSKTEGKIIIGIHGTYLGFTRYEVEKETPKCFFLMPVYKTSFSDRRRIMKTQLNTEDWIYTAYFDDMEKMLEYAEKLHKKAAERWADNQKAITDIRNLHSELRT